MLRRSLLIVLIIQLPQVALAAAPGRPAAAGPPAVAELDGAALDALIERGRGFLKDGKEDEALQAWTKAFAATEFDPVRGPVVALAIADLRLRREEFADAAHAYFRASRWITHPEAARAQWSLGECYRLAGRLEDAALAFRAVRISYSRSPLAPAATLAAGRAFFDLRRLTDAEAEFRTLLRDYTESREAPLAQLGLARVSLAQGNPSIARASLQAAAVLFAGEGIGPSVEVRLGEIDEHEMRPAEARRRYESVLKAPDRLAAGEARFRLSRLATAAGDRTAGDRLLEELAVERDAGEWSHRARLSLAAAHALAGRRSQAIALLESILPEKPAPDVREEAEYRLGSTLLLEGRGADTEKLLTRLLARVQVGSFLNAARLRLAERRLEMKDVAGAEARLREILSQSPPPPESAEALVLQADAGALAGRAGEPARSLGEVLDRFPDAPAALVAARRLLTHLQKNGPPQEAEKLAQRIAARYPALLAAEGGELRRGEELLAAGKPAEAIPHLRRVLEALPEPAVRRAARAALLECLARTGRAEEIRTELHRATAGAAPGELAALHDRLGRAYVDLRDAERARTAFRAALDASPEPDLLPGVLLRLARLEETVRPAAARAALERILAAHAASPEAPEALYLLAWIAGKDGEPDAVLLERLTALHPGHALSRDAAFRLGERLFAAGDLSGAEPLFALACRDPGAAGEAGLYRLGWTRRLRNEPAGAAAAFEELLRRFPSGILAAESRVRAGQGRLSAGQPESAKGHLEVAVAMGGLPAGLAAEARVDLARCWVLLNEPERARELAAPLVSPAHGREGARAGIVLGLAEEKKAGPAAGAAVLAKIASLFGRYEDVAAEAQYLAGEALERAGDRSGARSAWTRCVEWFAGAEWAARAGAKLAQVPAAGAAR